MLSCAGLSAGVEPGEGEALNGEANESRVVRIRGKREKEERERKRENKEGCSEKI